jgi:DNA repair protein RadC
MPTITSSQDVFDVIRKHWSDDIQYRESFAVLLLNRANKALGFSFISKGAIAATVSDPKMIFQAALKANASSIILVHNHPSGNLQPSEADLNLTKNLVKAGEFLELKVLDHLIIGEDSYFSFADEGLM